MFVQELLADSQNTRGHRGTGSLRSTTHRTGRAAHALFIPTPRIILSLKKKSVKLKMRPAKAYVQLHLGGVCRTAPLSPHRACSSHCLSILHAFLPCFGNTQLRAENCLGKAGEEPRALPAIPWACRPHSPGEPTWTEDQLREWAGSVWRKGCSKGTLWVSTAPGRRLERWGSAPRKQQYDGRVLCQGRAGWV